MRRLACAVLAAILAGCSAAPRVIPISVSPGQARPPAERIADYPAAFQAIAAVTSEELKLPIPRASLYLYPNRDAFEQGLITERQFEPALAREVAGFARGLGGPDTILVNEGALVRVAWPERIRFLAHEFTHVIQYDLAAGRRGTGDQWLCIRGAEPSVDQSRCGLEGPERPRRAFMSLTRLVTDRREP